MPDRRTSSASSRFAALGALALAIVAVGIVARGAFGPDATGGSGGVPLCSAREVRPTAAEAVTCRTRTATLTIGTVRTPVAAGTNEFRVLSASADGNAVRVRLRVRNTTPEEHPFSTRAGQAYLGVGGIRAAPLQTARRLPPAAVRTVTLRWVLSDRDIRRLREAEGRADLGLAPHGQGDRDRPDRLAVVRLEL